MPTDVGNRLAALFPTPRDDEPATLRQDIIDELHDHLACAYNRELLRGADSSAARQRVLERFGDPAAVARRLWLDAMKGKIMAQRVFITSCLVVTLACLSLVGLVYVQSSRATAQAAEANRKLSEALAQAQTTNTAMLTKLSEMSEAIRNPRSFDWNPLKFTIKKDTPNGPPVATCSVHVSLKDSPQQQITRRTDVSGVADFGLVNPGEYSYSIYLDHNRGTLIGNGSLVVGPGSEINKAVIYPEKAIEPVPLDFRCELPEGLEKEGLIVDAQFRFMPVRNDGVEWNFVSGWGATSHSVLLGPGTTIRDVVNPAGIYLWANSAQALRADALPSGVRMISGQNDPLKWERGTYQLSELIILRPRDPKGGTAGRLQFDIVVRCYPEQRGQLFPGAYSFHQIPPTDEELRTRVFAGMNSQMAVPGLTLSKESWSKIATRFDARPDHVNEWTIVLPDALIRAIRAAIKLGPSAGAKPSGKSAAPDAS